MRLSQLKDNSDYPESRVREEAEQVFIRFSEHFTKIQLVDSSVRLRGEDNVISANGDDTVCANT